MEPTSGQPLGELSPRGKSFNPNPQQRLYRFTPDELRALRECNKESFYQRCIPIGITLGGLTYLAVQKGILKPMKGLGPWPKVTAAVVMGYIVGKVSYQRKCEEKLMAIPDSKIGRVLKARRLGKPEDELESSVGSFSMGTFSGITDSYSDSKPDNSDDYGSRPTLDGLDDSFRPSLDNPIVLQEEEMPPEQKHVTTYEELRKKNREEYEQKRALVYNQLNKRPPSSSPSSDVRDTEFDDEFKPTAPTSGPRTKYGDVWG